MKWHWVLSVFRVRLPRAQQAARTARLATLLVAAVVPVYTWTLPGLLGAEEKIVAHARFGRAGLVAVRVLPEPSSFIVDLALRALLHTLVGNRAVDLSPELMDVARTCARRMHLEITPADLLAALRVDLDRDSRLQLSVVQPRQGAVEAPHRLTPDIRALVGGMCCGVDKDGAVEGRMRLGAHSELDRLHFPRRRSVVLRRLQQHLRPDDWRVPQDLDGP